MNADQTATVPPSGRRNDQVQRLSESLAVTPRNELVHAENFIGAAIIAIGGNFEHEAKWRAGQAVEHLLAFIASIGPPRRAVHRHRAEAADK